MVVGFMGVYLFLFLVFFHFFSSANFMPYLNVLLASSNLLRWNIVNSWFGMLNILKKLNAPDLLFYSVQITYEVDHSPIPCYSLSLKSQWLILCHVSKQKISSVESNAAWETFSTVSYRLAQIISLSGQSSSSPSPSLVFSLFMKRWGN